MLVEIRPQLARPLGDGGRFGDVVGVEERGVLLSSQMPEQPLLGDAFHNPSESAPFHARDPAPWLAIFSGMMPLPLSFGDGFAEAMNHTLDEPLRRFGTRGVRFVRDLAIELVA